VLLSLFRLEGGHYTLQEKAEPGTVLRLDEPPRMEIDPAALG
jgi:hypothetical protein